MSSDDAPKVGQYAPGVKAREVWDALARGLADGGKVPGGSLAQLSRDLDVPAPTVRSIYRRHFSAHYPDKPKRKPKPKAPRRSTKSRQPRKRDVGPAVEAPPVGAPLRQVKPSWTDISLAMRERLAMMVELDMAQLEDVRQMVREGVPVATAKDRAGKGYSHTIAQSTIPAAVAWDKAQLEAGDGADRVVVLNAPANEGLDDGGVWDQAPVEPDDDAGTGETPNLQVV